MVAIMQNHMEKMERVMEIRVHAVRGGSWE